MTVEQLHERLGPVGGLEAVLLTNPHPGKLPALPRQLVVAACERLLLREQLVAGCLPLLLRPNLVLRHWLASNLSAGALVVSVLRSNWIFLGWFRSVRCDTTGARRPDRIRSKGVRVAQ